MHFLTFNISNVKLHIWSPDPFQYRIIKHTHAGDGYYSVHVKHKPLTRLQVFCSEESCSPTTFRTYTQHKVKLYYVSCVHYSYSYVSIASIHTGNTLGAQQRRDPPNLLKPTDRRLKSRFWTCSLLVRGWGENRQGGGRRSETPWRERV